MTLGRVDDMKVPFDTNLTCLTEDLGDMSSIPARSRTLFESIHKIISTALVTSKSMCMKYWLTV